MNILDQKQFYHLKPSDVREWYALHHTEKDLADAYELVHRLSAYYEDCSYDYEEDTPEFDEALRTSREWDGVMLKLENDIRAALGLSEENAFLCINELEVFMTRNGYEEQGGWWFRPE